MPTHARWLRLVISLALALLEQDAQDHCLEQPEGPAVLFLLDEFASLGHMPSLATAAGLMAGFGVRLWPFLQDLSQLRQHYEKGWETFVGNAGAHLFFGNTDLTTLRHVSERLGKVKFVTSSLSITNGDAGRDSTSFNETTTPLLATDEIQNHFARRKMERDYLILLMPHSLPIALSKTAYFKDRQIAKLLGLPLSPEPPLAKSKGYFSWPKQ